MDPEPDDSSDWRRQPEWWGVGTVIDVLTGQWERGEAEGKIGRMFMGPNSVAICWTIGRGRMQGSAELLWLLMTRRQWKEEGQGADARVITILNNQIPVPDATVSTISSSMMSYALFCTPITRYCDCNMWQRKNRLYLWPFTPHQPTTSHHTSEGNQSL